MEALEHQLVVFLEQMFQTIGWAGVVFIMALESANIPIPSELIMPLSGWMLIKARSLPATYTLVAGVYGALGCTIGSIASYAVGMWGGRPFIKKYGRYILVSHHDLDLADQWFGKSGSWAIFVSRLLPVVRTFISLPAAGQLWWIRGSRCGVRGPV